MLQCPLFYSSVSSQTLQAILLPRWKKQLWKAQSLDPWTFFNRVHFLEENRRFVFSRASTMVNFYQSEISRVPSGWRWLQKSMWYVEVTGSREYQVYPAGFCWNIQSCWRYIYTFLYHPFCLFFSYLTSTFYFSFYVKKRKMPVWSYYIAWGKYLYKWLHK